jgi:hypothetical protein
MSKSIATPDFAHVPTETLRGWIGSIMTELRTRKSGGKNAPAAAVSAPVKSKPTAAKREQAKQEYKQRKAEHDSRPFGVRRVSDGKVLKRRFVDATVAAAQAAELTLSMKTEYAVVSL